MPALRLLPLPWHDRPAQQAMLILEHLVYGTVLGATMEVLQRRQG